MTTTTDPWPVEARAFLSLLEPIAAAAGMIRQPRFGNAEPSWCASWTVDAFLGRFHVFLWTTPAIASLDPPQSRLWVAQEKPKLGFDLQRDKLFTYTYRDPAEVSDHLEFVTECIRRAQSPKGFEMAVLVASGPNYRQYRAETLAQIRAADAKAVLPS